MNWFWHKHKWHGAGWGNEKGMEIKGTIMVHFLCDCGKRAFVYEPLGHMKARFDGYRKKYGDQTVYTDEFKSPEPFDFKTVLMDNNEYCRKYA